MLKSEVFRKFKTRILSTLQDDLPRQFPELRYSHFLTFIKSSYTLFLASFSPESGYSAISLRFNHFQTF